MPDTEQELEAKKELHAVPITDAEVDKVLDVLNPNKEQQEAENLITLNAYQAELQRLWNEEDYESYERKSDEMRQSLDEAIKDPSSGSDFQEKLSNFFRVDEERREKMQIAKESHSLRVKQKDSETLALSPEDSEEIRKKVEKKIILDSEFEALKKAFEWLAEKGTPTDEQIKMLHEGMDDIRARLDQDADNKDLQDKLAALENRYPLPPIPIDLTSVRTLARQVKAQYVNVQHRLTPEQRRAFRGRIARLSGMVRQIEDRRWHDLVGNLIENPKSSYLKGDKHVNASLVMAMARAKRAAPVLADLALAKAAQDLSTE